MPRVVYFHIGRGLALHNFETGEWAITLMVGNQHIEVPASYLLKPEENLGDPRLPEFDEKLQDLASKIYNAISGRSDKNSYRKIFPNVCNLASPAFFAGEHFSNYCVGLEEYKKKEESEKL